MGNKLSKHYAKYQEVVLYVATVQHGRKTVDAENNNPKVLSESKP